MTMMTVTMMTVTMMTSISTRTDDYLEGGEGGDYAGGLIEVWWGMVTVTAGRDTQWTKLQHRACFFGMIGVEIWMVGADDWQICAGGSKSLLVWLKLNRVYIFLDGDSLHILQYALNHIYGWLAIVRYGWVDIVRYGLRGWVVVCKGDVRVSPTRQDSCRRWAFGQPYHHHQTIWVFGQPGHRAGVWIPLSLNHLVNVNTPKHSYNSDLVKDILLIWKDSGL